MSFVIGHARFSWPRAQAVPEAGLSVSSTSWSCQIAPFPRLAWQFTHLRKRHFLRAKARVLRRMESTSGSALDSGRNSESHCNPSHWAPSSSPYWFPLTRDGLPMVSQVPLPQVLDNSEQQPCPSHWLNILRIFHTIWAFFHGSY